MKQNSSEQFLMLKLLPKGSFYVISNGKIVEDWSTLTKEDSFQICPRILGGKGGFGSLLRSFRIYRSTNQDMCRDLSGRRMKDVKEEEKLKKWIGKKAEREAEKERKRNEKYLRLKAGAPKHTFTDSEYTKAQQEILEKTDDAIEQGLKAIMSGGKEETCVLVEDADQPGSSKEILVSRKRPASTDAEENASSRKVSKMCEEKEMVVNGLARRDFQNGVATEKEVQELNSSEGLSKKDETERCSEEKNTEKKVLRREEPMNLERIDLEGFSSVEDLEEFGLDHLKFELQTRGLKCGGTLTQRAERLWSVRGLKEDEIPKNLKAKK